MAALLLSLRARDNRQPTLPPASRLPRAFLLQQTTGTVTSPVAGDLTRKGRLGAGWGDGFGGKEGEEGLQKAGPLN